MNVTKLQNQPNQVAMSLWDILFAYFSVILHATDTCLLLCALDESRPWHETWVVNVTTTVWFPSHHITVTPGLWRDDWSHIWDGDWWCPNIRRWGNLLVCTPPGYHGVFIDSLRGKDDVWKQLRHKTQNTHIRHSSKSYFTFQLCPPIQVGIETLFYDLIYLRK